MTKVTIKIEIDDYAPIYKNFQFNFGEFSENDILSEIADKMTRWASNNGFCYDEIHWEIMQ